jgi:hypothetical protein
MKRWLFFGLVVSLLVLWHGDTYGTLERRNRALERAIALRERQTETIVRQTGVLERQTEALNQCSEVLNRVVQSRKTSSRR